MIEVEITDEKIEFVDLIVGEIRANREAHAKEFHYDPQLIFQDLKKKEEEYKKQGYKFVSLPTKRIAKRTGTNG